MKIKLSDHFTLRRLLRFTLPSMVMMIFTSIYSVVDGFFVSNFAGKTAFAAVNFIMPTLMMLGGVGFMFGTGGSALVAMRLGEKKQMEANQIFSMLVYVSIVCGLALGILGIIFLPNIARRWEQRAKCWSNACCTDGLSCWQTRRSSCKWSSRASLLRRKSRISV